MDQSSARHGQSRPISHFYEVLEAASTLNQTCEITCMDDTGGEILIISEVHALFIDQGTEYVRLDSQVVPLNRITSVNGQRSSGKVDTALLEKGLQPNAAPATEHHKYPEEETQIRITPQTQTSTVTVSEQTIPQTQPLAQEEVLHHDEASDFVSRFSTTPPPLLIGENEFYHFSADRIANRLYLKAKQPWNQIGQVSELGDYIERVAPLMDSGFTLLNDLTAIEPDEEGTVWAPPIPNRSALLRNGLSKVADLVAAYCDTLVHSTDSFSVNSVPLRYFKDRTQALHWITTNRQDTDSINLSDHA